MRRQKIALSLGVALVCGLPHAALSNDNDQSLTSAERSKLELFFTPSRTAPSHYVPPPGYVNLFGAKVTGLNTCEGNLSLSLVNSFKDGTLKRIYDNFADIVNEMVSNPQGAATYLGSLYIQKSNAGLYSLLTEGINLGMSDYLSGIGSCEAILSSAMSFAMDSPTDQAKANSLREFEERTGTKLSRIDLLDYLRPKSESTGSHNIHDHAEQGVTFYAEEGGVGVVGGMGSGGNPTYLEVVGVTARTGYCIYRGIEPDRCYPELRGSDIDPDDPIINDPMHTLLFGDDPKKHPERIQELSRQVLGTDLIATCEGCKQSTEPGTTLRGWYSNERNKIASGIHQILFKNLPLVTEEELFEVSAPPSLKISLDHIRALHLIGNSEIRYNFVGGLAVDVAYIRSIALANYLRSYLHTASNTKEVRDAGLRSQILERIEMLHQQEQALQRELQANGYEPQMYVKALVRILERGVVTDAIVPYAGL